MARSDWSRAATGERAGCGRKAGRAVRRGLARDKGGEWAAADASRGSAMAVAYLRAGGYWCQAEGGEPLVRRARAHLRGDDCSRLAAAHGMGGEVAGHARAKANTRLIVGSNSTTTSKQINVQQQGAVLEVLRCGYPLTALGSRRRVTFFFVC